MKRIALVTSSMAIAFAIGCSDGANDSLLGGNAGGNMATSPDSLAGGVDNTRHHFNESIGGDNGITDPVQKRADDTAVGSPEAVARLHGTQKIAYTSLGAMLADLGVDLQSKTDGTAGSLFTRGGSALGMPIYANRVPEQSFPSTSSLAKQFDIFTAAAPEIIANVAMSTRCPGVVLLQNNQLTEDGVTCLIGKPARPEHIALANQAISEASSPDVGTQIAIAALLSASHTSE
jgi:hypothetical protein